MMEVDEETTSHRDEMEPMQMIERALCSLGRMGPT